MNVHINICIKRSLISVLLILVSTSAFAVQSQMSDVALAMPEIPDSLTDKTARLEYLLCHYWDGLDFGNRSMSMDENLMEQSFADFAYILPHAADTVRAVSIGKFLDAAASAGNDVFDYVVEIAEKYLYDSESPMYNEMLFAEFLRPMLDDERNSLRAGALLAEVEKNLPGTLAPDFEFDTREGGCSSLYAVADGVATLLIIYDPDCDVCHDTMRRMNESRLVSDAVANGELRIAAVYLDEDVQLWRSRSGDIPASWTVGHDSRQRVNAEELYVVRSIPTMHLIGADRKIIMKNCSLVSLEEYLRGLKMN